MRWHAQLAGLQLSTCFSLRFVVLACPAVGCQLPQQHSSLCHISPPVCLAARRYLTPLLVSLGVQLEPVLGPALGWALGVAAAPGLFTWIGGSIVLLATLGATLATARRQQQEEAAAAEANGRLLLKNKSMRLPSSSADGASYAAVAAEAHSRQGSQAGGGSSSTREGDMDVIVSERQQLLPASSQLSHHAKPHAADHYEIELPDIRTEQR